MAPIALWKHMVDKAMANRGNLTDSDPTTECFRQLRGRVHNNVESLESFQYDDVTIASNTRLTEAMRRHPLHGPIVRGDKPDDGMARDARMAALLPHMNKSGVMGVKTFCPAIQVYYMIVPALI